MDTPYSILGVSEGASLEECKRAYRRLCKIHHPDMGGDPIKFDKVRVAWGMIKSGRYKYPQEFVLTHVGLFDFAVISV